MNSSAGKYILDNPEVLTTFNIGWHVSNCLDINKSFISFRNHNFFL